MSAITSCIARRLSALRLGHSLRGLRGKGVGFPACRLHRGEELHASDNSVVSPTYVPDLVHATLDLLLNGEQDIWHLANEGSVSWHGLARDIAGRAGVSPRKIVDSAGPKANNTLGTNRGQLLRPLEAALSDFMLHAGTLPGRASRPA
jgi:dTDP-4-dehydrorhamnose reductase